MNYTEFLDSKRHKVNSIGKEIDISLVHHKLCTPKFVWQRDIVQWACRKGRCAIFLDTGLGKTFIQLEWARLLGEKTLIIAPLSVARQTSKMANDIDLSINYVRYQKEVNGNISITNYEMIDNFDISQFGAVVLDESSILKAIDGKTRKKLTKLCSNVKYKLCCTATPAPNDYTEIGNHAEFLGICTIPEMLATFFINANKDHILQYGDITYRKKGSNKGGTEWRIKHHAENSFFEWLASWAMTMSKPSDLGYSDDGFILPELIINPIYVDCEYKGDQLFFTGLHGISDRANMRQSTTEARGTKLKEIINGNNDQWIVWCGLDTESKLATNILNAVEVKGSDTVDYKADTFERFQDGDIPIMVTKPKIGGFGMNFQNAHNMVFFGLNDSWETYYQAIRREWRYGQQHPVNVYIIISEFEASIYDNVMRKEAQNTHLRNSLIDKIREYEKGELNMSAVKEYAYRKEDVSGNNWDAMMGDSCERLKELKTDSVDLSVYSPPFADLYTYTDSNRDLGNCRDWDEFFDHYQFIISEILRVTKPGRLTCVHTSDIPAMLQRDGYIVSKTFLER